MTPQEIFDKSVSHLRAQKKQSLDERFLPAYRGTDNTSCAIGGIFPDEIYNSSFEHLNIEEAINSNIKLKTFFDIKDEDKLKIELLKQLQITHDAVHPYDWEEQWQRIANDFGLNYQQ